MKNKKILILLIVLLPLLSSKCGDNVFTPKPDQLPPITQTGENTFGCLVDGELYLSIKKLYAPIIQVELHNKFLSIITYHSRGGLGVYYQIHKIKISSFLPS